MNNFSPTVNIAILASGRGSNLKALIDAQKLNYFNGKIRIVISNKVNAPALDIAKENGIYSHFINPKEYKNKIEYDRIIVNKIREYDVQLICLAGYMKILTEEFINSFPNQIINIHPSLLPAFPGLDAQKQAIAYGAKISGATVHFVDSGVDTGPIIMQRPVEVESNDTEETLSNRILSVEHQIYKYVVKLYCDRKLEIKDRKVIIKS
jgi:phosphoribosylglycinamide formyltransferase 1